MGHDPDRLVAFVACMRGNNARERQTSDGRAAKAQPPKHMSFHFKLLIN
jgi:hypothetical protein